MVDKNPGQVTAYLRPAVLDALKRLALKQQRSVSWLVSHAVVQLVSELGEYSLKQQREDGPRQVDLEDAIVAAVKRGPVKSARHK